MSYKTATSELYDPALLTKLYTGDRMTIRGIAEQVGVGQGVVLKWLKMAGIERRSPVVEKLEPTEQTRLAIGRVDGLNRAAQMLEVELGVAVRAARASAASWGDIGAILGIAQSTAHARFSEK